MTNHRGMTRIFPLLSLIIVLSIPLRNCAPTQTKSLAPIWLPDDSINANQHRGSGSWYTKSSDTTASSDTKSDGPVIRHISSLPMKKEPYYAREWGGSFPFSILYVNTPLHNRSAFRPKSNGNKSRDAKRPTESITTTKQPSTSPTTRGKNGRKSRTQYSIIPELFMSYGWGGWGK